MHSMLILNKFQDSYQVFENNPKLCFLMIKKGSRTHKKCLNNFFWPKILSTNTQVLMYIKPNV
jgi:hypothetical protein